MNKKSVSIFSTRMFTFRSLRWIHYDSTRFVHPSYFFVALKDHFRIFLISRRYELLKLASHISVCCSTLLPTIQKCYLNYSSHFMGLLFVLAIVSILSLDPNF